MEYYKAELDNQGTFPKVVPNGEESKKVMGVLLGHAKGTPEVSVHNPLPHTLSLNPPISLSPRKNMTRQENKFSPSSPTNLPL